MPVSTLDLIKARTAEHYERFLKEIETVTADEACRYSRPDWPEHRWGIGQNGSIAGIVIHVAAWKQMTLPLLRGAKAIPIREFDVAAYTPDAAWSEVVAWYRQVGREWADRVLELTEDAFDLPLNWEGMTISMTKLVNEVVDHDIQHASQIEYLKQRMRIEK